MLQRGSLWSDTQNFLLMGSQALDSSFVASPQESSRETQSEVSPNLWVTSASLPTAWLLACSPHTEARPGMLSQGEGT